MALLEGEFYILNEKARAGLPNRIGERCLLTDIYYSSPNYDYLIEFDDGDTAPVKESELNKLTEKDIADMNYIFKGNLVIYTPTHEEVLISKVDYLHGQVEIDFMDGSSITTGFETLRQKEVEELPFVEEAKNDEVKFQHDDLIKVCFKHYENEDGTYTIPKTLLNNLLNHIFE
jgi:hypothetical protein